MPIVKQDVINKIDYNLGVFLFHVKVVKLMRIYDELDLSDLDTIYAPFYNTDGIYEDGDREDKFIRYTIDKHMEYLDNILVTCDVTLDTVTLKNYFNYMYKYKIQELVRKYGKSKLTLSYAKLELTPLFNKLYKDGILIDTFFVEVDKPLTIMDYIKLHNPLLHEVREFVEYQTVTVDEEYTEYLSYMYKDYYINQQFYSDDIITFENIDTDVVIKQVNRITMFLFTKLNDCINKVM